MKKLILVVLMLATTGVRADWLQEKWGDHEARKRVQVQEALAELNPALAAMQFEMEYIDGRRRAGTPKEGDAEVYAQIVHVLMLNAEQAVEYSQTPEGKAFFARWAQWAKEHKQFIEDWKESL